MIKTTKSQCARSNAYQTGEIDFQTAQLGEKYDGIYYGTGDIFASALIGAYMCGKDITESADIALEFTCGAIKRTHDAKTDTRFGVNFEQGLGDFIKKLGG